MPTIHLNSSNGSYDIVVSPGLLADLGPSLRALCPHDRAIVVTDSHVAELYLPALQQTLTSAGYTSIPVILPPGEPHKDLRAISTIADVVLLARIDRKTPLLALGGGLVGDVAGFAAASLLRGIPFIQIPTTLLAMVDASVGGKTGVNHAAGKNLIGAFHQPRAVFIDPRTLASLPPIEFQSGLAECMKHDIIRDAAGFADLESSLDRILARDESTLTNLIAHNVAIKARVVETDPFERGERAHLNLGHTFGHAIETTTHYAYTHGQAVALGTVAASRLAVALNLLTAIDERRIAALIARAGLPTSGLTVPPDDLIAAMATDKKVAHGKIRFVLPQGLGRATLRDDVPPDLVRQAILSLR